VRGKQKKRTRIAVMETTNDIELQLGQPIVPDASTSFTSPTAPAPFLPSPAPKDAEEPKAFLPLLAEEPDAKAKEDERETSPTPSSPNKSATHFATQAQSSLKDSKV
jgi:hypothetical protein